MDLAHFWNTSGAYQINQSLRFDGSSWLARTNSTDTNRKTWTLSYWVKKSAVSSEGAPFSAYENDNNRFVCKFRSGDDFEIEEVGAGAVKERLRTNALHRDASAWYHIVIVYDVTNGTAADRLRIYRNGVRDSALNSTVDTYDWAGVVNGSGTQLNFGRQNFSSPLAYFNGYIAEAYLVDGTALTPSSFGETDTITGAWIPKKYTGSYGSQGFYLKFDPTATNGIGHDHSGNGNNFTATGFSTSGTGTDVMSDTPTNNWTTLNPITPSIGSSLSDGNLVASYSSSSGTRTYGTTALPATGRFYFECTITGGASQTAPDRIHNFGLLPLEQTSFFSNGIGWFSQGTILLRKGDNTGTSGASGFANNDVLQCAVDCATGKVWMGLNNSWYSTASSTTGDPAAGTNESATFQANTTYFPFGAMGCDAGVTGTLTFNFGQRAFAYTPPTGYKALNTANLPEPTIKKGDKYFDTKLYTGDSNSTQSITGVGFQPDFVWIKNRGSATDHLLFDAVRGVTKVLKTVGTGAEETDANAFQSFNSDGFTLGTSTSGNPTKANSNTYVAWAWDANGAGSSNTAGSITSTVSANATAGFSIATYTGNGTAGATVGHGLGVAPKMIIVKQRSGATDWQIGHTEIGWTKTLYFNTSAATTETGAWNNTAPTSTVFSIGTSRANTSSATYVAYCFSEVAGYSKFGSYTGNGSTDGPFVFCGFRPRWILTKRTDSSASWTVEDTARIGHNPNNYDLYPDTSDVEGDNDRFDILSNGFKARATYTSSNASGGTYIFAAFAELPAKYSNAR